MKLFGNSRGAARSGSTQRRDKEKSQSIGKGKKILLIILSVLLLVIAALCVFVSVYVRPPEQVHPGVTTEQTEQNGNEANTESDNGMKKGYYNILLAGTDNDGLRTDTMMIARLDTVNHTVSLMSVPRDTLVYNQNGKPAKLTELYGNNGCGEEGMEALMLKLEEILGFMPSGYTLVDLDVFMELVNAIGGVYFDVPQRMYHNDPTQDLLIDLQPGYQLLDGDKAMQLVRFRGYTMADIQRTHVQQDFIMEVAKQCISKPSKIGDYIEIFSRNVTTNFKVGNLLYFAQELAKCDLDSITTYTLPGSSVMINNIDYYDLFEEEVAAIVEKDFDPYLD